MPEQVKSQNSTNIFSKISIKSSLGIVSIVEEKHRTSLYDDYAQKKLSYGFDINYKLSHNIDIGLYTAYSNLLHAYKTNNSIGFNFSSSNVFFYGVNSEVHLIPLLTGSTNTRFDISTILKAGMVSEYWSRGMVSTDASNELMPKKGFEIGLGLGVSYMFTKHTGIFLECNIGNFYNDDFTRIRSGIKVNL